MTRQETEFVQKISARRRIALTKKELNQAIVKYQFDANFTKAVVHTEKGVHVGVAKRNPNDVYNPETGKRVALRNAVCSKVIAL